MSTPGFVRFWGFVSGWGFFGAEWGEECLPLSSNKGEMEAPVSFRFNKKTENLNYSNLSSSQSFNYV